jgi:GDPmannose 4,6-dehydratase
VCRLAPEVDSDVRMSSAGSRAGCDGSRPADVWVWGSRSPTISSRSQLGCCVASTALITGVAGQDGSYLTEYLLDDGYRVHGLDWDRAALARLEDLVRGREDRENVNLHLIDVTDAAAVRAIVARVQPDEVYNLASQSRVHRSYSDPDTTFRGIVVGTANILEAIRDSRLACRIFQASSCEMFGESGPPQREHTAFRPVSPYASAKMLAHHWATMYRETYGMYVCAGIMFNHESPRRSPDFVTRRITQGVAQIVAGQRESIPLGSLENRRDWGNARDYVRAMRLMLQQPKPADYLVATGESRSVAEFAELAFSLVGLHWKDHVSHDAARLRPADPQDFRGDASRIRALGWKPEIQIEDTVREMLDSDLRAHTLEPATVMDVS